jgi:hypothetical protein
VALRRFQERRGRADQTRAEREVDEEHVDGYNLRQRKADR